MYKKFQTLLCNQNGSNELLLVICCMGAVENRNNPYSSFRWCVCAMCSWACQLLHMSTNVDLFMKSFIEFVLKTINNSCYQKPVH